MAEKELTYAASGVDTAKADQGLSQLLSWVQKTFSLNSAASPHLPIGYFANVIRLEGLNLGIAISTDGAGTKLLVAEMMGQYNTVGIDCMAMNVNDLLCVGATPVSFVDYVAVEKLDPHVLGEIGKGLFRGAELARVNIAGGEIAQLPEMIKGVREGRGMDLAGTAIGTVPLDRVIVGQKVRQGNVVIGLASSGIHSNGLTLARRILFQEKGLQVDSYLPELGRTIGEELLEPTRIYVPEVVEMIEAGLALRALIHITGDGFFNLTRTEAAVGYLIHTLPDPPAIFEVLQQLGAVSEAEMFQVYNMGIGFCLVVDKPDAQRVIDIAAKHGSQAWEIGLVVPNAKRTITLEPRHLQSQEKHFVKI